MTTPRYFNAHCHLELSHLGGKIPPGLPFVEWLAEIVRLKRATDPAESVAAARAALDEMHRGGTLALFDILSMDIADVALAAQSTVRSLRFREVIEFQPADAAEALNDAAERQAAAPPAAHSAHGLSPHSPYTCSAELLRASAAFARERNQWLCIHAAETAEEFEMFTKGTGALHDFLAPFLPDNWRAPGKTPIAFLDEVGCLGLKTLLVHCNEITDADIALIKNSEASVVLCPGTHVYFQRGDFPLVRLLDAGVPVYLGTDSLASNESLDMAREIDLAKDLSGGKISHGELQQLASPGRASRFFSSEASPNP
ncbi:hypothetical protein BH09SUM1_BH09SUM1_07640 [soil metagenome]